ncbi:MAG: lytic transglycosylase domain-containing protein [Acidovorax sp.]|uniref:lytic transglycosylase domain-containing protein n=1 Tax=Acidovorax sp. TaxID=1872122 RepID=UPI0039E41130
MTASGKLVSGVRTFAADVTEGFLEITHNSFALIGLAVAFIVIMLTARPDLRQAGEEQLMTWLQARQAQVLGMAIEPGASERATASNPKDLPKEQAAVAFWLSKKYRVAPEPLAVLVAEAYDIGAQAKIDPTLILAIMAIESSFNPFAQSAVGAQGLMQVMTRVHTDKYQGFGGHFAAFDPVSNLRVGVKVLQECIARAGSLEGGLRFYVGAANQADDGGYAAKVLAEHFRLRQVAGGRAVPLAPPPVLSTQAPAQAIPVAAPPATPAAAASDKVALLSDL